MRRTDLVLVVLVALWATGLSASGGGAASTTLSAGHLPDLPRGLTGAFVGTSGDALLVAGGRPGVGGGPLDTVYLLPVDDDGNATAAWRIETLATPLADGAAVVVDGAVVCIGGLGAGGPSSRVTRLAWRDGVLHQERLADLPASRAELAAAVLDGMIYVTGGHAGRAATDASLLSLDPADPQAEWQALPASPTPGRLGATLVDRAGALYLLGGRGAAQAAWSYRPTPFDGTRQRGWLEIAPAPVALQRASAYASGQSHLLVLAAKDGRDAAPVLAYHTVTDTWVEVGTWDGPRPGQSVAEWQGGVVLVGGLDADGRATSAVRTVSVSASTESLHWLDYAMIGVYLVILIGIGGYFANKEKTSADFLLGGRRIPWWAAGISLYATGTSAISFMAIPTKTYVTNQVYGLGSLWSPIFWIPAAFVIIPLIRRLDLTSTYEYLERRFSLAVRLLGSLLCVAFQIGGRMSIILLLPAMALSAVTGLDVLVSVALMGLLATVYTVLGGIQAVIWTDVLQCAVLIGGGLLAFALMIAGLDGSWSAFAATNLEHGKFSSFMWGWDITVPVFWIFALSSLTQLATFPNDQVMVQRVLATPDPKSARNAAILLAVIVVPGTILFHLLGSALFAHFAAHPENLSPTMENIHTLPLFIVQTMPIGVTGLVIAGLFAASMSSLDSSMSSTATVVVTDFYRRFRPDAPDQRCLALARWLTGIVGLLGTGVALLMATFEIRSLYDMWMQLVALLGGGFAGVYALGMLTRRAHGNGALVGAVASIILTVVVKTYTPLHFMLYGVVSVVSCIGVGYLASLVLPGRPVDLSGLTVYTRTRESTTS